MRAGPAAIGTVFLGILVALGLVAVVEADEPANPRFEVPIGMTAKGTPLIASITKEDLDLKTEKCRILLIGGRDGGTRGSDMIQRYLKWFDTDKEAAVLREKYLVSAVPNARPDGGLPNEKLEFPPREFYNSAEDREAAYLWRWIGMFAPDSVIVDYWEAEPDDPFAAALGHKHLGGVGAINSNKRFFQVAATFDEAFRGSGFPSVKTGAKSAARQELIRRQERSAREVTEELLRYYGRDIKEVAYIPALAVVGRMRYAAAADSETARQESAILLEKLLAAEAKPAAKSGSQQAGHLLFAEAAEGVSPARQTRLIELIRGVADEAFDAQGKPRGLMPHHNEMSDAVFMAGPILAAAGKLTGEKKYFDACYQHLVGMRKLCLRDDGLYRHSPLDEAAWGRGNGFPALGLSWVLHYWPKDDPRRKEILNWHREHLTALLAHQDVTGCWHQVIDHPASYREFSCTAMIGYAMLEGILAGELDCAKFEPAVQRSWKAIKLRIGPDGKLVDVCTGTGKQQSLQSYFDRPAILGVDDRGGAMALLFATSMLRMEEPE